MADKNPALARVAAQGAGFVFLAVVALGQLVGVSSCVTTPLPIPPTVNPDEITITDQGDGSVIVEGGPGAVDPGGEQIRVTSSSWGQYGTIPRFAEPVTDPVGGFSAHVAGTSTDRFYIEHLTAESDVFVVAVTSGPAGAAVEVDPGSDSDRDGSPDAIDCAPDDPDLGGRRCD